MEKFITVTIGAMCALNALLASMILCAATFATGAALWTDVSYTDAFNGAWADPVRLAAVPALAALAIKAMRNRTNTTSNVAATPN